MKSIFRKAAVLALAGTMGAALLTGCGSTKVDGTQTVVTVNDEKLTLGVASFYSRFEQGQLYSYMAQMLGSSTNNFFDGVADSSTGDTYGETMKDSIIKDLENLVVLSQHASDYGVSLTDEEETAIDTAAQGYIDSNSQEVRDKIGASKKDVVKLMELQTIQSKMRDPMVADVDTNVTDEEAQQAAVTYVAITSSSTSSTAAAEATSSDSTSSTAEGPDADALQAAQSILSQLTAEADPASADMDTIAKSVGDSYSATTGNFTVSDTTDGTVDSAVVEAVQGLSDGTVVDHIITGSDGTTLYVARLDTMNDTEATASKKTTIVTQRKQDKYDELLDGWVSDSEITVNDKVWDAFTITDKEPFTLKAESTVSSTAAASEAADSVSSSAS
jgi:foldase protein PrsA